jgi:hypothetical protein
VEFLVPNYLGLSFILPPFWLGIHKKISCSSCVSYNFWPFIVGWFLKFITSIARLLRINPVINSFIDKLTSWLLIFSIIRSMAYPWVTGFSDFNNLLGWLEFQLGRLWRLKPYTCLWSKIEKLLLLIITHSFTKKYNWQYFKVDV